MSQYQFSLDNGEVVEVEAATYEEAIEKANENSSGEEVTKNTVVSVTGEGESAPIEAEVMQPQAAPPAPQKAMTIRDTQATSFLDPNVYIQLKALAADFVKSKAIPTVWATPEQVLVGLQTGAEMGMKPMEAMNSLYPVNGAINVWGKATTRRLKEHGWTIKYSNETQETCTATVTKGKEKYTETYTFDEAVQSGYTGPLNNLKIGWRPGMNRRKKLRYGVLSLIISTEIPEVLGSAMGIVEVSDDYDLGNNPNPAQLADQGSARRSRIEAAEAKRKKLDSGKFTPSAVKSNEAEQPEE